MRAPDHVLARTRSALPWPGPRRHPGLAGRQHRAAADQHRHLLPPPLRPRVPATAGRCAIPGSVSTFATADWVPTQWLSEVAMAKTEDWFGLAGVAWLSGLLEMLLFLGGVRRGPRPRRAAGRDAGDGRRPVRHAERAVDAAAGGQLPADGGGRRRPGFARSTTTGCAGGWCRWSGCGRCSTGCGRWPWSIGAVATVGLALDRAPRGLVVRGAAVTGCLRRWPPP